MGVSAQYLADLIDRMATTPIHKIMRDDERALGHTPVIPGDVPWLSPADWPHHVVVSLAGSKVRIIAIVANEPGNGAFRRLIDGIAAANLTPVVIAPSNEMRATLKRWGWRERSRGYGLSHEERWSPKRSRGPVQ